MRAYGVKITTHVLFTSYWRPIDVAMTSCWVRLAPTRRKVSDTLFGMMIVRTMCIRLTSDERQAVRLFGPDTLAKVLNFYVTKPNVQRTMMSL